MRINELKEQPLIVDLTNEPVEVQERVTRVLNKFNEIDKKWVKRIELVKVAQREGWTEEQYDAECKKRNI